MKKALVILILLLGMSLAANAQEYETCVTCKGTGRLPSICVVCGGTGGFYDYYGFPHYCPSCGGSGTSICYMCLGMGKRAKKKYVNPTPYTGGSVGGYSGRSSGSSSTSSSSRSSKIRETCLACDGTGKGREIITYRPNYTGQPNDEYCAKCGSVSSAHYHRTPICTACYGKGYIEP